jgi:A/G-specific adenine glycosylase
MKISEPHAIEFRRKLKTWYSKNHRKLPWRENQDPYRIWISEIMLQQTTVQTVIPYFLAWMTLYPDMLTLSKAPLQKILKIWQGLGYYNRAKNLHRTSKIIMADFDGKIPQEYDELIKLPGFGPYTTAAVLSIAYDKSYLTIDANIRRILMRILNWYRIASSSIDKKLDLYFSPLLPRKDPGTFNQALMELGSLVCRPKNPLCLLCPVLEFCGAYKAGKQEVIPVPEKRSYKKIDAVIGIIERNKRYLIQKRPPTGLLADLWEFPGGKIEQGESAEQALRREIQEEIGAEIHLAQFLTKVQHSYTQYQVSLQAWSCTLKSDPVLDKNRHRWVTLRGMRQFPFPSGSAKIIQFLEKQSDFRSKK